MSFAWHEIRDHLMQSSSNLHFQRSFDAIRRAQAAFAPFRDPAALLDGLHSTPGDPARKNQILSALVRAAQSDGPASDCALTLLLLALWPGLDAIRHRSIWRRIGAADEVASDVLARTIEAIRSLDLGRINWIAATVLRNVERDMIRVRQRDQARERLASGADTDEVADNGGSGIGAAGYARLNGALRKLLGDDALLVIRVAIEGFSQAEVAVELDLTEAAARKRYQRAMRRLHDALQEIPEPMSRSGPADGFSHSSAPSAFPPNESRHA
ncbi:MAG: RNA polymerase sigma factor [Pannonibacter sp.]